jgi:hypothetical protein
MRPKIGVFLWMFGFLRLTPVILRGEAVPPLV